MRTWTRTTWFAPFLVALLLFSGGSALTALLIDPTIIRGSGASTMTLPRSFGQILVANLGAAMFLFSGVAFAGVTTVLGLIALSVYVGSTLAVAAHNAGWAGVIGSTWSYVLLEFLAVVLAATAGLHPVTSAFAASRAGRSRWSRYLSGVATSLKIQVLAVGLLAAAAAIEAGVISSR